MKFDEVLEEAKGTKKREKTIEKKYGEKFVNKKKEIADAIKEKGDETVNPYAIAWAVTKKMKKKGKL